MRDLAYSGLIRKSLPSGKVWPPSTLTLQRGVDGSYAAQGENLTLTGDWRITAQVGGGSGTTDVPFLVACNPNPQSLGSLTMVAREQVDGTHRLVLDPEADRDRE